MRGHCEIRLHNKETHTYKKIDADNLVTNAYKYIISHNLMMYGEGMANIAPIAEKVLGGVMLFDGALTENANNVHFPAEAHLVGYGDRSGDTSDPKRGTFNQLESGPSDQGYTLVWDFSTAQCNGQIAAVSLTNVEDAKDPVRFISTTSSYQMSSTPRELYCYYHDGEYGYVFLSSNSDATGRDIQCRKYYLPTGAAKVWQPSYVMDAGRIIEEFTIRLDDGNLSTYNYCVPGYIVASRFTSEYRSGQYVNTLKYSKIDVSDWTVSQSTTITIDGITSHGLIGGIIAGDYAWFYNGGVLYRMNLNTPADISEYRLPDGWITNELDTKWRVMPNGIVYVNLYNSSLANNYYHIGLIYPDGTIQISHTGSGSSILDGRFSGYSETLFSVNGWYRLPVYLGTICNLSSPVTKTAATTMKVIYTLTDV